MSKSNMQRSLPPTSPRSVPEAGSQELRGGALFEIPAVADEARIADFIDRGYGMVRDAVALWGGPIALASLLETAFSTVSERLNRKEVKGATQRAFVDYLFIALTHPQAGESFLFGLCDLLGFEHPKRRKLKSVDEKHAALVKALRLCGPLGEAAIARAASDLGADVSEFE